MHDLTSISADLDNFHFLAFIRDFQKFQNGLEQKLVDRFGWNFFSDVYLSIGSPNKKRLLLGQLFLKSDHPSVGTISGIGFYFEWLQKVSEKIKHISRKKSGSFYFVY